MPGVLEGLPDDAARGFLGNHPESHGDLIGGRVGKPLHVRVVPGKDRTEIGGKREKLDLAVQSLGVLAEYGEVDVVAIIVRITRIGLARPEIAVEIEDFRRAMIGLR